MEIKEEWRPVKGFEGLYEVSNLGRIKSLSYTKNNGRMYRPRNYKEKIIKTYVDAFGYVYVMLAKKGEKQKHGKIHRLVAEAFITNENNLPMVNHKDENKQNNSVNNLEWCTAQYNLNYGNRSKKYSKRIEMIDIKTNKVIKCFESIREAEDKTSINHSHISSVCHNNRKTAGGYKWRYAK